LPSFQLRVSDLETALRKTVERNSFVDYLKLWFSSSEDIMEGYNEVLTLSVVNNILMYFLSLPLKSQASVYVEISNFHELTIRLRAVGFEQDPKIEQIIRDPDASHYVDVLQASNFTYLYAALKIATHLRAVLAYTSIHGTSQEICLTIPRQKMPTPN
jgi:hypothetical protein